MSNTKVTTGEVRFSFPHVFQPHANNPGQEEKYSVTILIPKTDTATTDCDPNSNAGCSTGRCLYKIQRTDASNAEESDA